MSILLLAGSPADTSRSAALLDAAAIRLAAQGAQLERLRIRDLPPQALLLADWDHTLIAQALAQVQAANALVMPRRCTRPPTAAHCL